MQAQASYKKEIWSLTQAHSIPEKDENIFQVKGSQENLQSEGFDPKESVRGRQINELQFTWSKV